jgi:hypothetical protein
MKKNNHPIDEQVMLTVGEMVGSDEIAVQLVPVFEENMEDFDDEGYGDVSPSLKNYLFFVWFMGFACGLDNAENVSTFLSSEEIPKGSLQ